MGYFGRFILGYGILPTPLTKPQLLWHCLGYKGPITSKSKNGRVHFSNKYRQSLEAEIFLVRFSCHQSIRKRTQPQNMFFAHNLRYARSQMFINHVFFFFFFFFFLFFFFTSTYNVHQAQAYTSSLYIEDIYFFEVNTKYISSSELKI